ncbi:MAG: Na+/H+ antiporter NhaA [Myxococcota bacterium]
MAEHDPGQLLPTRPVDRLSRRFEHFLHVESASGVALLGATALALILANSPLGDAYQAFFDRKLHVGVGDAELRYPLWYWINDALMVIFFFVIGLEIKRELVMGELRDRKQVVLPVAAAAGGAAVPVAIFFVFGPEGAARDGWAIPMATDIAFVVGCLALMGDRVPRGLKVLMLALAIVDDIFAVLIIAVFYSAGIELWFLAGAAAGFGGIWLLNRLGVRTVPAYIAVGAVIWLFTLKSGVHPTVAGVLLGLLTPTSAFVGQTTFLDVLDAATRRLRGEDTSPSRDPEAIDQITFAAKEALAPIERLERDLHPWVAFFIMPVFALANAGVQLELGTITEPLSLAVAAGLVLGKPLGITAAALLVVALGWARLPDGVGRWSLLGGGCLAGIGFTMALFIASLGLEGELLASAKAGVLLGSLVSAVLGFAILLRSLPRGGPERAT